MTRTALGKSLALAAAVLATLAAPRTPGGLLKDGDLLAVVGDSITEGRQYSGFVEDYLLMCQPLKLRTVQLGWSGEQATGLVARLDDVLAVKPNVVTLSYGMNDGRYAALTEPVRQTFQSNLLKAVQALRTAGVTVLVGSPGAVDSASFKGGFTGTGISADGYNQTLGALADSAATVAKETDSPYADIHAPMLSAMKAGQAKYGLKYSIAGTDGVHPQANGGLVMAYAYLKGLGFDGDVGTVHVDLATHQATATGPHAVTKVDGNAVSVHSTGYPFCFFGDDPKAQTSTEGLLDALPFNPDLNRLTLTADGPAARYRVKWGSAEKTFTREQLKAGVNLAAEFLDNPFVAPFHAVHDAVQSKQYAETLLFKQLVHTLNAARGKLPGHDDDLRRVIDDAREADRKLSADVAALVKPVDHTISFEPVQ